MCCDVFFVVLHVHSCDSQDEDYKSRWRSIRVMYFTMFLSSIGEEDAHEFVYVMKRWNNDYIYIYILLFCNLKFIYQV